MTGWFGLSLVDLAVICGYFAAVIAIGFWSARRIKSQEDYFLGGRRFGKFIQTFAAFGQSTSADNAVGVTTTTFTNGIAGVWSSLLYLLATPMYWLVMPWMRRLRLLTLGDFFEERYGSKWMAGVYAVIGSIGMMTIISVGFAAMTKTVVALAPKAPEQMTVVERDEVDRAGEWVALRARDATTLSDIEQQRLQALNLERPRQFFSHINPDVLIWVVCLVVMVYAVAGGLEAAFLSDALQGIFIILLSLLLFPFAWARINTLYGGSGAYAALQTVHEQLPESYFELFGSPATVDFTWYYILALTVMATINVVIQPNALVATGSAKGEYECRFGFVTGCYMKRVCTVLWGFFALSAIVLYHDRIDDPDLVWGTATLDLLGPLNIGLVGLMIACLMAALMSTADCLMITGSSLLTHNLYRPLFPGRSERHYVVVGRVLGAVVVIGGALIATQFDTILQLLKLWWELNVMVAASFWLGMKWRRANRTAAWCSIISTALLFFLLPIFVPLLKPGLRSDPRLTRATHAQTLTRSYRARELDVQERMQAVTEWEALSTTEQVGNPCPQPLTLGQTFEKSFQQASRSIFWTKGLSSDGVGRLQGQGMLSLELVLLDRLGVDLQGNPYALNETIRIMIRTVVPFLILIGVACVTRRDDVTRLDRFYVKMKTRVLTDPAADARNLEHSYADPRRFDGQKRFPRSAWEFDLWDRTDTVGFIVSCLVAVAVIVLLVGLTRIGGT